MSSNRSISASDSGSNSFSRRKRSTSAWSANESLCQSMIESPRSIRRTESVSASVSSSAAGGRATRGKTVATTGHQRRLLAGPRQPQRGREQAEDTESGNHVTDNGDHGFDLEKTTRRYMSLFRDHRLAAARS